MVKETYFYMRRVSVVSSRCNLLSYYVWTYSHIVQGCLVWTYEHIGTACSVRGIVVVSNFQCSHACSVVSFASKRRASDVCVSLVGSRCHLVIQWCVLLLLGFLPLVPTMVSVTHQMLERCIKVTLRRYINM